MLAFCLRLSLNACRQPYHQRAFFYTRLKSMPVALSLYYQSALCPRKYASRWRCFKNVFSDLPLPRSRPKNPSICSACCRFRATARCVMHAHHPQVVLDVQSAHCQANVELGINRYLIDSVRIVAICPSRSIKSKQSSKARSCGSHYEVPPFEATTEPRETPENQKYTPQIHCLNLWQ
jgi:hypothetical protein